MRAGAISTLEGASVADAAVGERVLADKERALDHCPDPYPVPLVPLTAPVPRGKAGRTTRTTTKPADRMRAMTGPPAEALLR